jgi:hypothetical protein
VSDAETTKPPPPEEPPMEIHKPKPVHSWRELLTELGIVVLGICIAISLEQFVEYVHWHNEVQIGRKALAEEIATIDQFYGRRLVIAPCLDRRLNEDAGRIRDLAAGRKITPRKPIAVAPGALLSDAEWQSERSSQTLTHFPRAELALMSRFYAQMGDVHEWIIEEERSWSALEVLADDPDHLGPADLAQLRVSLNDARAQEYLIVLNARRQLEIGAQLGIPLPGRSAYAASVARWCRSGEKPGQLPENPPSRQAPQS